MQPVCDIALVAMLDDHLDRTWRIAYKVGQGAPPSINSLVGKQNEEMGEGKQKCIVDNEEINEVTQRVPAQVWEEMQSTMETLMAEQHSLLMKHVKMGNLLLIYKKRVKRMESCKHTDMMDATKLMGEMEEGKHGHKIIHRSKSGRGMDTFKQAVENAIANIAPKYGTKYKHNAALVEREVNPHSKKARDRQTLHNV